MANTSSANIENWEGLRGRTKEVFEQQVKLFMDGEYPDFKGQASKLNKELEEQKATLSNSKSTMEGLGLDPVTLEASLSGINSKLAVIEQQLEDTLRFVVTDWLNDFWVEHWNKGESSKTSSDFWDGKPLASYYTLRSIKDDAGGSVIVATYPALSPEIWAKLGAKFDTPATKNTTMLIVQKPDDTFKLLTYLGECPSPNAALLATRIHFGLGDARKGNEGTLWTDNPKQRPVPFLSGAMWDKFDSYIASLPAEDTKK